MVPAVSIDQEKNGTRSRVIPVGRSASTVVTTQIAPRIRATATSANDEAQRATPSERPPPGPPFIR
jgi:hypothetical protein